MYLLYWRTIIWVNWRWKNKFRNMLDPILNLFFFEICSTYFSHIFCFFVVVYLIPLHVDQIDPFLCSLTPKLSSSRWWTLLPPPHSFLSPIRRCIGCSSSANVWSGTTSPVAGQISLQFCAIDSTPRQQMMPQQLANIFSSRNSGAAGKRRAARPGHGPWHIWGYLDPEPPPHKERQEI